MPCSRSLARRVPYSVTTKNFFLRRPLAATRFTVHLSVASPSQINSSHNSSALLNATRCVSLCSTPVLLQSWGKRTHRQWMCIKEECRHVNRSSDSVCSECGEEKPRLMGWKCTNCATQNHRGVKKCKSCGQSAADSAGWWMCAACKENNRVDEIEDNSVCGFCGYDMAPLSKSEEEILRESSELVAATRAQQEAFDGISAQEAEEQLGDPIAGFQQLPNAVRSGLPDHRAAVLASEPIKPFRPAPVKTAHSRLHRRLQEMRADQLPGASNVPAGPPGFDWMCRKCHHINPGDEEACLKCHEHINPCDWECPQCAALNHLTRSRCFNCRASIPVCWECTECQVANSVYDTVCYSCGTARPAAEPKLPSEADRPAFPVISQGRQKKGDWYCEACNAMNFSRRTECFQCGAARSVNLRPDGGVASAGLDGFSGGAASSAGFSEEAPIAAPRGRNNWYCQYCQASNFRTRRECWQCGRTSSSAQQSAFATNEDAPHYEHEGFQEQVRGLAAEPSYMTAPSNNLKSNDWTCAKCFAKNYGSRKECYKCGALKTAAVATRRATARKPVKL